MRTLVVGILVLGLLSAASTAIAQAPLHLVDGETTVRKISFRFRGSQTFEGDRLREQISTQAPGFFDRVRGWGSILPGVQRPTFPFDPITLQKDVVRLRRFYRQNGFPRPEIDYPASQLDTTSNQIHLVFTIQEGTPLIIQEIQFLTGDGDALLPTTFEGALDEDWRAFRRQSDVETGERYTEYKRTRIDENLHAWLRNQGFAFAQVQSRVQIDSVGHDATLRFLVDPGPLAYVSEIMIEGNESVSDQIVRRELPFSVGDRFSAAKVSEGQRRLFDLSLFRVALADVPDQPRDSTVTVRYRVRETQLRAYSGQVGYGTHPGVTLEGSWRHRNFFGDARTFVVGVTANTGYPQNPPGFIPSFLSRSATRDPNRRYRTSITVRQPYLMTERLSASLEPFAQERINPALNLAPDRLFGLNERQFGINTSLVYDILPFRSLSLQHTFARIEQFRRTEASVDTMAQTGDDLFDKSVFSLRGTFGKADDFINPSQGYLVRPQVELGGVPFESGVDFVRVSGGLSGYLPLSERVALTARLFGGVLWPLDESHTALTIPSSASDSLLRRNQTYQDRFSEYLFYAGGSSDVRGWQSQLGGGKVLRGSDIARAGYIYRPTGARSKLGVNFEFRLPAPGLGSDWRTAVFLDAAYLDTGTLNLIPSARVSQTVMGGDDRTVGSDPTSVLVGTGAGIRYKTPFGFVRLDVAYKVTPDRLDLRRPGELGQAIETDSASATGDPVEGTPTRFLRRFRLHFGIGRSF